MQHDVIDATMRQYNNAGKKRVSGIYKKVMQMQRLNADTKQETGNKKHVKHLPTPTRQRRSENKTK